jgi:hypothetical protein
VNDSREKEKYEIEIMENIASDYCNIEEIDQEDIAVENIIIRNLKIYCDTEEFIGGEKKYRSVFRMNEAETIYVDAIIMNVRYLQFDWEGALFFLLYNSEGVCIAQKAATVYLDNTDLEATATTCFTGIHLQAGDYHIRATTAVDDEDEKVNFPIADDPEDYSIDFQIVDIPEDYGHCFVLEDFSFYRRNEGEEATDYRRNTLTGFALDKLEAIDAFFLARNKLSFPWPAEFFVSVFDQTGMLKESTIHKGAPIEGGDPDQFHFFVFLGEGQKSYWRKGNYRVEVVFMNELIIEAPFVVGEKDIETPFSPETVQPRRFHGGKRVISASALNIDPLDEINRMIGLHSLKKELKRYVDKVRYNEARVRAGYVVKPVALHSVYLGNPGTGKTTVARLMGKVFHELGLLTKGHVVVEERNSLTGKFYGSEEEKTTQALERAQGGVLFIDEAYTLLVKEDPKDPGRRIMETLLTTLSDEGNRDICIILAGYPNPMIDMLNENPGMKSRLPNVYHFDDYSVDELMQIARSYMETNQYVLTEEAEAALHRTVEKACSRRDNKFGNGRYIISLLENRIIPNLASRLIATGEIEQVELINRIEKVDVESVGTEITDVDYFKQKKNIGFHRSDSH